MPRNPSRVSKALLDAFFQHYPDEAVRMMERLPQKEIVKLLEQEAVPRTWPPGSSPRCPPIRPEKSLLP
jgi:hypothetical protein